MKNNSESPVFIPLIYLMFCQMFSSFTFYQIQIYESMKRDTASQITINFIPAVFPRQQTDELHFFEVYTLKIELLQFCGIMELCGIANRN